MTGLLDIMHAVSFVHQAAAVLNEKQAYRWFAKWIWQSEVRLVIDELTAQHKRLGLPEKEADESDSLQEFWIR